MNRLLYVLAAVFCAGVLNACSRIDDTNLEKTVAFFYNEETTNARRYDLLSREAQAQWPKAEYVDADLVLPKRPTVVGAATIEGIEFARVSTTHAFEGCERIATHTWKKQDGHWRRVRLRESEELVHRKMTDGDYTAAREAAERLLEADPYSIDAYRALLFATSRRGNAGPNARNRSEADILRSLLAINASDSETLFVLTTHSASPEVARRFFEQFAKNDCYRENAAFNLALALNTDQRLAFLEQIGEPGSGITMLYASTLAELGREDEFLKALGSEQQSEVLEDLADSDPAYAASWSATLARHLLQSGRPDDARKFLDLGLAKDPTEKRLAHLAKRIADPRLHRLEIEVEFVSARPSWGATRVLVKVTNRTDLTIHDLVLHAVLLDSSGNSVGTARLGSRSAIPPGQARTVEDLVWNTPARAVRSIHANVSGLEATVAAGEYAGVEPADFIVRSAAPTPSVSAQAGE